MDGEQNGSDRFHLGTIVGGRLIPYDHEDLDKGFFLEPLTAKGISIDASANGGGAIKILGFVKGYMGTDVKISRHGSGGDVIFVANPYPETKTDIHNITGCVIDDSCKVVNCYCIAPGNWTVLSKSF